MALHVIGAGWGRTGTMSLKLALEHLGFGRCHHMIEVIHTPGLAEKWRDAYAGRPVDWDAVFAGFGATVDWPSCDFWRELADHAPQAKVVLSVRDSESWFRSTQATIFSALNTTMASDPSPLGEVMRTIGTRHFGGQLHDRARLIAAYERHNEEVRRSVPKERLLEYNLAEGWEPLCRFLGKDVPATPLPTVNSTDEFRARIAAVRPAADKA